MSETCYTDGRAWYVTRRMHAALVQKLQTEASARGVYGGMFGGVFGVPIYVVPSPPIEDTLLPFLRSLYRMSIFSRDAETERAVMSADAWLRKSWRWIRKGAQ